MPAESQTNRNSNQLQNSNHNWLNMLLKTLMSFIGVTLIALGATFLQKGKVGLDPFTAMNIGLANHLHMGLGIVQLVINIIILIIILFFNRKQFGIGTILNMVLVGFEIQWFSNIYEMLIPETLNIFVIIVDGILGLLLFTLGTSAYMTTNLGVAPYDAIAPIIFEKTKFKYRTVRSIQDILFMLIGLLLKGAFGVMTIVTAFFAGPLIQFWNRHINEPLIKHINHFSNEPTIKNAGSGIAGVGRQSYAMLYNAYQQTTFMQKHLSGYSNKELLELIHDTKTSFDRINYLQNNMEIRYRSLLDEAKKRNIRVYNKNKENGRK